MMVSEYSWQVWEVLLLSYLEDTLTYHGTVENNSQQRQVDMCIQNLPTKENVAFQFTVQNIWYHTLYMNKEKMYTKH